MSNAKRRATSWYNKNIVFRWYRTWTVYTALTAAVLPELLQFALENLDLIVGANIPFLDDTNKSRLQLLLILLVPVVRSWKQKNLAKPVVAQGVPE